MLVTVGLTALAVALAMQYGQIYAASRALESAARDGAKSALRPGASRKSVGEAVSRSLRNWKFVQKLDPVAIEVNGFPAADPALERMSPGDYVAVTVSVDTEHAVWGVLRVFGLGPSDEKVSATHVLRKD